MDRPLKSFFFFNNFIYLGCARSSLLHKLFSSCGKHGLLYSFTAVASLAVEGLQGVRASAVAVSRL